MGLGLEGQRDSTAELDREGSVAIEYVKSEVTFWVGAAACQVNRTPQLDSPIFRSGDKLCTTVPQGHAVDVSSMADKGTLQSTQSKLFQVLVHMKANQVSTQASE